ncbi:MAG: methylated-DNA--[protein]-cysteine S-methyltransferase [Phycisphaerales bacterium]|nr:methylated-DNA--[protein]-cysteine S-methyltransferase [Phycisphaerales bacterium]
MHRALPEPTGLHDRTPFASLRDQLDAYFAGTLRAFDATVNPKGTPFQHTVWDLLMLVPHGQTRTYADIAAQLGDPSAVRAVGAANGANPIAIIVPCHRVVAKSGALQGYAGGLDTKRWLLDHEARHAGLLLA